MFFYFSFLRTPQSNLQSSSVVFTPKVTNDLHTVPFPTSIDILYWWIKCTRNGPQNVIRLTEPAKLNTRKPLQIPPPPSKKQIGAATGPGIDCSLALAPAPIVSSSVIDLRDPEIRRVPLPVFSLPIRNPISPSHQRDGAATATRAAAKLNVINASLHH